MPGLGRTASCGWLRTVRSLTDAAHGCGGKRAGRGGTSGPDSERKGGLTMTALEIIGMILLLFLLLSLLRVGAIVDFGGELRVRLRVGPVKLTVLPRKEKKHRRRQRKQPGKRRGEDKAEGGGRTPPAEAQLSTSCAELAGTALGALKRTLRRTCRRTRIDPLEVGVIFAGDDPADTAQTYGGYANAALWTLMPKLEELFYIPKAVRLSGDGLHQGRRPRRRTVGVSLRVCDPLCHSLYVGGAGGKMVPALAQGARGEQKRSRRRARGCAGNERTGKTDCIERKITMENKEKNIR